MRVYSGGFFAAWVMAWLPVNWWQWGLLLFVIGITLAMLLAKQCQSVLYAGLLSMSILVVALGFYIYAQSQLQHQLPQYLHKQLVLVSGCYQVVSQNPGSLRITLSHPRMLVDGIGTASRTELQVRRHYAFFGSHIQLNVYDQKLIAALVANPLGALTAQVVLSKPRNYHNPGAVDFVAWGQRQGQIARGYIKQSLVVWRGCQVPVISWFERQRYQFRIRLKEISAAGVTPNVDIAKAIWAALISGYNKDLKSDHWQTLHRTGTTHLLVISGLHIGFVAMLFMLIGRHLMGVLGLPYRRGLSIWLGWASAVTYAMFSGWGLPAQRAVLMLSALMLINRFGLGWTVWQRLLLAWGLTLLVNPTSLYSPGFWYSYVAVANLAMLFKHRQDLTLKYMIRQALLSQLALLALLSPLIGATSGGISLLGSLLNLLLIPLFGVLVIPTLFFLSLLLFWLDSAQVIFTWVLHALAWLWQCLDWLGSWPCALLPVGHWPPAVWCIWALLGLLVLLLRYYAVPMIMTVYLVIGQPTKQQQSLTVFDVGQGLALWLQTNDKHLLYDLGDRFPSGFNLYQAVVQPSLGRVGVKQLERVYISHWDRDHSGGLTILAKNSAYLPVGTWWLPSEPRKKLQDHLPASAKIQHCHSSKWQTFGTVKLRHFNLWAYGKRGNNASCVLQIELLGQRILVTGDIEWEAERKLIDLYGNELRSDIMIAPHHGSRTSSSEVFLQRVAPRIILISAGYGNRFGHPHKEVLTRYWQHGLHWYNTAVHGQIRMRFDEGRLVVEHTYN